MPPFSPASIIDILRKTLRRLEESQEISQEDPAFMYLRSQIVRSIAELEVLNDTRLGHELDTQDAAGLDAVKTGAHD
jgi:hypothetical protein